MAVKTYNASTNYHPHNSTTTSLCWSSEYPFTLFGILWLAKQWMLSCCSYLRSLLKAYTMVIYWNTGKLLHSTAQNNRLLLRRSQDLSLNWHCFNSAVFLRHKDQELLLKLFRWGNYTSVSVTIPVFQYAKPVWLSVSALQWVSVAFESSVQRTQSKISWVHVLHANFVCAYTTQRVWTQLQSAVVPLARNCSKCQMFRLLWSSLLQWQNDCCTAVKMSGTITISI